MWARRWWPVGEPRGIQRVKLLAQQLQQQQHYTRREPRTHNFMWMPSALSALLLQNCAVAAPTCWQSSAPYTHWKVYTLSILYAWRQYEILMKFIPKWIAPRSCAFWWAWWLAPTLRCICFPHQRKPMVLRTSESWATPWVALIHSLVFTHHLVSLSDFLL